ncbi:hypothetical protein VPH35_060136 [Triticum aestivum]|uniref:Uncharacterized protein n=1 Tax=Aegilops tauschii subsp. strangulata TaxID=200361 RepID=A0A453F4S0_AEGTS
MLAVHLRHMSSRQQRNSDLVHCIPWLQSSSPPYRPDLIPSNPPRHGYGANDCASLTFSSDSPPIPHATLYQCYRNAITDIASGEDERGELAIHSTTTTGPSLAALFPP